MKLLKKLILILLFSTVILAPAQLKSMDKIAKLKPVITKVIKNNKFFFSLLGFYLFLKYMAYRNPNPILPVNSESILSNTFDNRILRFIIRFPLFYAYNKEFSEYIYHNFPKIHGFYGLIQTLITFKFIYDFIRDMRLVNVRAKGDFDCIKFNSPEINEPVDQINNTALVYAFSYKNQNVINQLINSSYIDLNRQNQQGRTALMMLAAVCDDLDYLNVAKTLLFAGVDPLIKDVTGKTFYDYVHEIQNPNIKKQFEDLIAEYKEYLENLKKFGSKKLSNYIHDLNVTGLPKEVTSIIADYCVEVKDVDKKEYAAFVEQERKKLAAHLRTLQLPGFNNEVTNIIADYCM